MINQENGVKAQANYSTTAVSEQDFDSAIRNKIKLLKNDATLSRKILMIYNKLSIVE